MIPQFLLRSSLLITNSLPFAEQVIAAVLRGSKRGRKRYSAHLLADAVRCWYHRKKLVPRGISVNAPSVQDWALKVGNAIRKLEARLHRLLKFYLK